MTTLLLPAALALLFLAAVLPGRPGADQRAMLQNRHFAHRGLHTPGPERPENSLAAFAAAAAAGYGIELDVQLSADGQVVVFHDPTLDRVAGVPGRVDAHTWQELSALRLCGGGEGIPLFSQVLALVDGTVPLIVELKPGPRRAELCQKTLAALRGYAGPFCIESFDPRIVGWFRHNAPDVLRGQLAQPCAAYRRDGMALPGAFALSRCLCNFWARPQFIAFGPGKKSLPVRLAGAMGAAGVRWTVRPDEQPDLDALHAEFDVLIFEGFSPAPRWQAERAAE